MGYKTKIRLTIFGVMLAIFGYAQDEVTVKGLVADSATNKPLPFVNIVIKGAARGTTSDRNGFFTLIASQTDTLSFSFVGYRTEAFPVRDWEPSVIILAETATILNNIVVQGQSLGDPYAHLFDEENMKLKNAQKPLPFYYSKDKKEKIKLSRAKNESLRVKHYVDLLVKDDRVKKDLMKRHRLTDDEYYEILAKFNQKNYAVMYYLSDSELLSLVYRFYDVNSPR